MASHVTRSDKVGSLVTSLVSEPGLTKGRHYVVTAAWFGLAVKDNLGQLASLNNRFTNGIVPQQQERLPEHRTLSDAARVFLAPAVADEEAALGAAAEFSRAFERDYIPGYRLTAVPEYVHERPLGELREAPSLFKDTVAARVLADPVFARAMDDDEGFEWGVGAADGMASDSLIPPVVEGATNSHDLVHQPTHYARYVIEPITFINANNLPFNIGNVVKYALRHDMKDGVQDLRKAIRYLEIEIECIRRREEARATPCAYEAHDLWTVAL